MFISNLPVDTKYAINIKMNVCQMQLPTHGDYDGENDGCFHDGGCGKVRRAQGIAPLL